MRLSRGKRLQATAISAIGTPLIEALGGTYTWRERGQSHLARLSQLGRPPIFAFWHGRILAATLYFRDRGIIVITSENFDGEWIAGIIERFGYGTARGSTSRGGRKALLQLTRDLAAGRPAGFTVDGPRGPARVAQPGAVWLAKATGNPLLPFHLEANRHWTLNSWDRTQIPKPFATIAIAMGEPLEVPRGVLEETVTLLRRDPQTQGVDIQLPDRDLLVLGDVEQLRAVFLNVMLNGVQAMQGRGTLRLSAEIDGPRGVLRFRDTGPGIPPEVLDRIFEPFFTTKHRGTGLGLAIARRIVELHDGTISIRCPPGGGTEVELALPLVGAPAASGP